MEHPAAFEPYHVHDGFHLNFRYSKDSTVAFLEENHVKAWNYLAKLPEDKVKNTRQLATDSHLFNHGQLRWTQLLQFEEVPTNSEATGTQNAGHDLATLYSCIEYARYYDKNTGEEIKGYRELKKKGLVTRILHDPIQDAETLTEYNFADSVKIEYFHKERV